ncbi:MAG: NAD(P)/FAD-dependent oxidoreductase [Paramuribaculum sp.]|nr:NAD(P)/FAD-dependent oxidoreductase [Paramuribaculum sp.]
MKQKKQIVVIGGGFAGMNFAKRIDKRQYDVVLVDRNNFHSFPPLFYQIASSGLQPDSICFPFRREFSQGKAKGVRFHIGEVERIDTAKRTVVTQYEEIPYDILVIAAGTTNNFFGNPSLVDSVYTLKSAAQAMRCRDEILDRLERASLEPDATKRREMLTFTVVGGGPAGVEIAGSLGEMKSYILNRNYPDINKDDVSITLMEGSGALLGAMSEKAQQCALQYLEELNVKVELHTILKGLDGYMATLGDDSTRFAGMVIWTAGVMAPDITFDGMSVERGHGNRILVDEYNRVRNQSQPIYVLGDMALMTTEEYPHGHPQLAQVAIQQGQLLARNLNNSDKQTAFKYHDKGTMATVGRGRAVADIGRFHYSGFMAWIVWMGVHLLSLLGMRNKINVFIDWIWGYFTYGTSLRLLLYPARHPLLWKWGEK